LKLVKAAIFPTTILILFALLISRGEKPIQQEISLSTGFYTNKERLTEEAEHDDCEAREVFEEYEVGTASWYGYQHCGNKMANGQKFNPNVISFAHKKLPIDSKIRVTNLLNGKTVVGQVTDRGPYVGKRILDVSREAAKTLGFKKIGKARVKIEILKSYPG
jgi:rare lipoprotein A (peptidoglycan hydrolase)